MAIFTVKSFFLDIYRPIYKRAGLKRLSFGIGYVFIATLLSINFYSVCAILGSLGASKTFIKIVKMPYFLWFAAGVFILTFWMLTPVNETLKDRNKKKQENTGKVMLFALFTIIVFAAVKLVVQTPMADSRFIKVEKRP